MGAGPGTQRAHEDQKAGITLRGQGAAKAPPGSLQTAKQPRVEGCILTTTPKVNAEVISQGHGWWRCVAHRVGCRDVARTGLGSEHQAWGAGRAGGGPCPTCGYKPPIGSL